MKLISPFKSLLQGGVILSIRISAAGSGGNVQMDILPQGKDSATGVSLPPKALVGTPEEIDAQLEEYLQKYAASVTRVADQVANADAELKTIEEAAAAQARNAIEAKRQAKAATPKPTSKPAVGGSAKDMKAGLLEDGGASEDDGGDEDGDTPTTLISIAGASAGGSHASLASQAGTLAAAVAGAVEGVSADLFNV